MTPGPLGMDDTSPRAEAPAAIAAVVSARDLMQQILTRGEVLISMRDLRCPFCISKAPN